MATTKRQALKKTDGKFMVEEAIFNPRNGDYSFRFWGYYDTQAEAEKEARRCAPARVMFVEPISQFMRYE